MHIPTYAGLLSLYVTLLLCVATKSLSNIFCDLQLMRYNFKGAVIRNNMRINCCSETLRLPISAEEQMCLFKEFY